MKKKKNLKKSCKKTLGEFLKRNGVRSFLIALVLSLVFYMIVMANGAVYSTNDDIAIRSIVSGQYTGESSMNMIFAGFPFSGILYALYTITDYFDWYGIVLIGLTMFFLSYTVYAVIKQVKSTQNKILCATVLFGVVAFLFAGLITRVSYTTTAGFIAACSLVLYMLPGESKVKKVILAAGIILAFGIRMKACLMVLIFFVPAWIYKNYGDKKKLLKDVSFGAIVGVMLVTCFGIEKMVIMNNEDWNAFSTYNEARSLYFDYYYTFVREMPEDERIELFREAGFTDEEADVLFRQSAIAFYDDMPEKMQALVKACEARNMPKTTTANYLNIIGTIMGSTVNIVYVGTVVILALIVVSSKEKARLGSLFGVFVAMQLLLLGYLIYQGRVPERVYVPLYFAYIVMNIFLIASSLRWDELGKVKFVGKEYVIIVLAGLILVLSAQSMQLGKDIKKINSDSNKILGYFGENEENIYIYDRDSLDAVYCRNRFLASNYINMSGWSAFSPLHEELIQKYGADTLRELLFRENAYLVSMNSDFVERTELFIAEKSEQPEYKDTVQVELVDEKYGYYIYKFSRVNEKDGGDKEDEIDEEMAED